jgi:uncharacterized membrane protein
MRQPMPSRDRPAPVLSEKMKAGFYWTTAVLSVAALVIAVIKCFAAANLDWPETAVLAAAVAGTVATLARQLPLLHAVFATILITVVGGGMAALNAKTGLPFGPYIIGQRAGAKLFNVLPWAVPLLWPVAILSSRGVARLILRPWRKTKTYGFRLIGLAAVLAALFEFTFEPFASRVKHYWYWEPTNLSVTWQGAPLVDFFSWMVVTGLILSFITPVLINKKPRQPSRPDFFPLGIWLGGIALFGAGCAAARIWPAVAADAVIAVAATVFAVRGARW